MTGSSSPQKKQGLRCECGKLLIEKDPEMGLGVRCGRRECDRFYTLDEINKMAVEFEQKETRRKEMEENNDKPRIPRGELWLKLNDVLIKADFVPEDVPKLVELVWSRAMPGINNMLNPCHCGACGQGIFIPALRGYLHPEGRVFDRSNLEYVTLGICSVCGYIDKV